MSNKPKIWGDAQGLAVAIGKAAVRAIERVDAPHLKASGPNFTARKIGAYREVETNTPPEDGFSPRFWIQSATPSGQLDAKNTASEDGLFWRTYSGNGVGNWLGEGIGISISHGAVQFVTRRGFFDYFYSGANDVVPLVGNPPVNVIGAVHAREHYTAAIRPWRFFLRRWRIPGALRSGGQNIGWDDGAWQGQVVQFANWRVFGGSFVGPGTIDADGVLTYAMTTSHQVGVDDYGFAIFQPTLMLARSPVDDLFETDINHYDINLAAVQPPLGVLHSTLSSTPIMVSPKKGVFFIAELFQPQRLRYLSQVQPKNPASRMLLASFSTVDGSLGISVMPTVTDYFEDDPAYFEASSHIPNDPAFEDEEQYVANPPDHFDCLKNLQMGFWCSGGGGGIARADGESIVWTVARMYRQDNALFRSLHAFVFDLAGNVLASQILEPQISSEGGGIRVIRIDVHAYLIMLRGLTSIRWWASHDNGESWEEISVSIGGITTPQRIGLPFVADVSRRTGEVTLRVTAVESVGANQRVALYESKDGMRTVKRKRTLYRIKDPSSFVFYPSAPTVNEQTTQWPNFPQNYYTTSHARPQQIILKNGRKSPVDLLCPWLYDENYEKPQGV